ncbi:MAG TPA: EscU/YscU/HrcU family type III secretion system export apparatus switch protein [bacterium]|nr:EscU/YscU/HrcU family type III secretion system export apparatus switch protein [bacterium]
MAAGDRTEAPTLRRRERARTQGMIARTPMAAAVGAVGGAMLILTVAGTWLWGWIAEAAARANLVEPLVPSVPWGMTLVRAALWTAGVPVAVVAVAAGAGALILGVAQTGGHAAPAVLRPQITRLNPLAGISRLVSWRGVMEIGRVTVISGIVGLLVWHGVRDLLARAAGGQTATPEGVGRTLLAVGIPLLARTLGVGAAVMVADYAWQRLRLERDLRMTRQEVREDIKETEGDPYWKARRRARARAIARARMMQAVPSATVVVTNPTHVAVALRYGSGLAAPQVVAKGQGHVAERIRAVAWRAGVPLHQEPALARALYTSVDVGQFIPPKLYRAVAEVIGWVYRTARAEAARG